MAERRFVVTNGREGSLTLFALSGRAVVRTVCKLADLNGIGPMAIHPSGRVVYAATRKPPHRLVTFLVDDDFGLGIAGTEALDDELIYLSTDREGKFLFGVSYRTGHLFQMSISSESGLASKPSQPMVVAEKLHAVVPSPGGHFLAITSLAEDSIVFRRFDAESGCVEREDAGRQRVERGSGPRHLCFSHDGSWLFVLNELTACVDLYQVSAEQTTNCLASGVRIVPDACDLPAGRPREPGSAQATGEAAVVALWAADLRLSRNGSVLFATERTTGLIAAFAVDPVDGTLAAVGHYETESQPRSIAINNDGEWLVSLGERSDHLAIFSVDANGALRPTLRHAVAPGATWVEFLPD
jgi:6-phosphogluconolactonase